MKTHLSAAAASLAAAAAVDYAGSRNEVNTTKASKILDVMTAVDEATSQSRTSGKILKTQTAGSKSIHPACQRTLRIKCAKRPTLLHVCTTLLFG